MRLQHAVQGKKEQHELWARIKNLKGRLRLLENRIQAMERGRGSRPSALRAVVDANECVSCGICRDTCPNGAVSLNETARVDPARCMGCGLCVEACPRGAIHLKPVFQNFSETIISSPSQ